ncbi:MAG: N utilization substance protein B [Cycloclasticus pugetii]|jgi:N utilization substance protein B|uniref:Transcription antitermination protein NusB n=2 Tax=Cycloclasticus TaxID=34067 RepID=S5TVR2_9GAMM|nr:MULTISPECIES: transcription antitermination factor NusB [Cycloclasticus]AFT67618.1 transcription termination factor nusb protein [Cycloclasticus sp. P1]AGS39210.1 Transcription antitermination protein NusB [Cycloclasticus zancles 78-ME]ATI02837.1 transcription antitermination factor NusB [Cycloclasticus sp. PY97N]EPD13582.1 transcription termination factor nusb protein [Cycloclasticus pugetii]MBV1898532.1 transcription antitermination factor NusB [Cycloclasticus sp.]|tara:strand:- start:49 stop:498 length:450 start_codon:yes stop_codon:yes gene_type:complete
MSSPKSNARLVALQALYQWQITGQNLNEICKQFEEDSETPKYQTAYFEHLLIGVVDKLGELDEAISEFTTRNLEKIDPIEKAVLRLGAYELFYKPEVPYRVAINESINLAKKFGSEKSHAYVNSIMDKLAQKSRAVEINAKSKGKKKTG